jgi:hypothetical protein
LRDHPFDEDCQLTIGDLHGNGLKLMYFLVRQNVIDLDESDYLRFAEIYLKDVDGITKEDLKTFEESRSLSASW